MSSSGSPGHGIPADDDRHELPFKELRAKEFAHLQLTNASTHFSWWLFNLKSQVLQTHSGYGCVFDHDDSPSSFKFQQSFSKLLHTIVRDPDAFVIIVDAAARHPSMPGSRALHSLESAFLPDTSIYAQQLRSMLQQPIPTGTPLQSIVSKFLKIRSELATLDVNLDEQELIGALMNVLPMPDFTTERNNLLMFPQKTFDGAVEICRKTSFLSKPSSPSIGTSAYFSPAPPPGSPTPSSPPKAPVFPTAVEIAEATAVAISKVLDMKLGPLIKNGGGSGGGSLKSKSRPVCTYCHREGHVEETCFKKERDLKMPIGDRHTTPPVKPSSTQPSGTPFGYIASSSGGAEKPVIDSPPWAFIAALEAEDDHRQEDDISDIEEDYDQAFYSQATVLMPLKYIQGDPSVFMDPQEPIRYLGLCCGASLQIIEEFAAYGRRFDQIYLSDKDDVARSAAQLELVRIADQYDDSFSPLLKADIYEGLVFGRIPQDVTTFSSDDFITLEDVNMVVATPDCHPFSTAGPRRGFADPRSTSFISCVNIIHRLSRGGLKPLNYLMESVPGATTFSAILEALDVPLRVQAHHLGSAARRDTVLWSNCRSMVHMRSHYLRANQPIYSVRSLLEDHKFSPRWEAPPSLADKNFPKFVSRPNSHAYRMHGDQPGKGMLLHDGEWKEPNCSIRAAAMGFKVDHLAHDLISVNDRHRLLGQCIDGHICHWFVSAVHSTTAAYASFHGADPLIYTPMPIIFDTAATRHMWGDLSEFDSYTPYSSGPVWINGISCYAFGEGIVHLEAPSTDSSSPWIPMILHNVLYVPDLQRGPHGPIRLFSWTTAHRRVPGLQLHLTEELYCLQVPGDQRIRIVQREDLLFIDGRTSPHSPPFAATSKESFDLGTAFHAAPASTDMSIWHARLGHLHYRAIQSLVSKEMIKIPGTSKVLPFCDSCSLVKRNVAPINRQLQPRATIPFTHVGLDFWETRKTSLQGNTYVFGATCYATSLTFAVFLKSRSSATDCLQKLSGLAQSYGFKLHVLRMDNDSVFHSDAFTTLITQLGLRPEFAAPNSQHQNGLQERSWGTLARWTLCMLQHASLSPAFWEFAFAVAVHIHNRTPRASGVIPMEAITGQKVSLDHLRVFGCPAFAHIPADRRQKMDPPSREGIFVGYASDSKAWMVYFPTTRSTISSRSVTFNEQWRPLSPSTFVPGSSSATVDVNYDDIFPDFDDVLHSLSTPTTHQLSQQGPAVLSPTAVPFIPSIGPATASVMELPPTPSSPSSTPQRPPIQDFTFPSLPASSKPATKLLQTFHDFHQATSSASSLVTNSDPNQNLLHVLSSSSDDDDQLQPCIQSSSLETLAAPPPSSAGSETDGISQSLADFHISAPSSDSDSTSNGPLVPPLRRSSRVTRPPDFLDASMLYNASQPYSRQPHASPAFPTHDNPSHSIPPNFLPDSDPDPTTYRQAISSADGDLWAAAITEEYEALVKRGTWELVPLPPGRIPVRCKWVFKRKLHADGTVARYKARLCAKGFTQQHGIDYNETFSPTVSFTTLRTLFCLAAHYDLDIQQTDVDCAFLYADLQEEIYMTQPEGFYQPASDGTRMVCLLKKAIYGLKQAPFEWNATLHEFFLAHELRQLRCDSGCYVLRKSDLIAYLAVYVDDIVLFSNNRTWLIDIKTALAARFDIKDLGEPSHILGVTVVRDRPVGTVTLHQGSYIRKLLDKFGMSTCKPVLCPGVPSMDESNSPLLDDTEHSLYRQLTCSLIHLTVLTRPDIAEAVARLCRYLHSPRACHLSATRHVFRYLQGTADMGITYGGNHLVLQGYSDSNFTTLTSNGRSLTGYCFFLCGGAISYRSKLQSSVAKSTAEAEYIALGAATAEALYLHQLLGELHVHVPRPIMIGEDNHACLSIATTTQTSFKTRHIRIEFHFIRDAIHRKDISVEYVESAANPADIFTKPLKTAAFQRHRATVLNLTA